MFLACVYYYSFVYIFRFGHKRPMLSNDRLSLIIKEKFKLLGNGSQVFTQHFIPLIYYFNCLGKMKWFEFHFPTTA